MRIFSRAPKAINKDSLLSEKIVRFSFFSNFFAANGPLLENKLYLCKIKDLNELTLRQRKTPYNELIFKEVTPIPPPINLDATEPEKASPADEKLPTYALRLIRRLLNIVDTDFADVSIKFTLHNIHTVLQLIRYTYQQLCCMDGMTDHAVKIAERALKHHGLRLGTDIRWNPEKNDYYIYPKQK